MVTGEPRALPIGLDNFYDIRSNDFCYVDKTCLIQRLLDTQARTMLFTRPRRFGKSLVISMLQRFFDCNEKEKNRSLFEGLAVAQSERHMAEQGKYPVISLNLKDARGSSLIESYTNLRNALRDSLSSIRYLLQSDKLHEQDKSDLQPLLTFNATAPEAIEACVKSVSTSLGFICSMLAKHHGQPVVILIDEYDAPLHSAYLHGFYQPICNVIRNLFSSALKSNDNLRLGVITGVLRIAKDSLLSGLNNLKVDTILSERYADCFGFTQAEVNKIAREYAEPDKIQEIQEWYDGYRFGNLDIYNPWSVIQYFDEGCKPQAYWLDASGNDLIVEILHQLSETQLDEIKDLYEGGHVDATVDTSVTFPQMKSEGNSDNPNVLYSLMTVSGFLKPIERLLDGFYRLVIPNKEIKKIYADEILRHTQTCLKFNKLINLHSAIIRGEDQAIAKLLNEYILASLSYFDTTEKFYHGWMMGLLFALSEEYVSLSNREAGKGRYDIVLKPRPGRKLPGIIFELKHCDNPEQLAEKAEEALQQIGDRHNIADFPPEVQEVRGYGVSFCQKACKIAQRNWQR